MDAIVGQQGPFDRGREQMKVMAGLEVTAKSVERTEEAIGAGIAARDQREIRKALQLNLPVIVSEPIPILYVQMDGTGVPAVKKDTEGRKGKTDGQSGTKKVMPFAIRIPLMTSTFMSRAGSYNRGVGSIFSIGHSTRPIGDFIALLTENGIQLLADVRTVPRSRYNPQFNRDTLPDSLRMAGIEHVHMPELGGLRHPKPDSPNSGWRNDSFRGYADYMQTREFAAAIDKLIGLSQERNVVVMCAESVPWRCHRNLIADALAARGITVTHIMSPGVTRPHTLTSFAEVSGERVLYPGEQPSLDLR